MRPIRIILVDDDARSLAKTAEILTGARYEVSTCSEFPVASRLVKTVKGMAIVVCGLKAANGCGLAFMTETIKAYGSTPFILLAPRPSADQAISALRTGAHDLIRKPVSPAILLDSVARAIQRINLSIDAERQEREARADIAAMRAEAKAARAQNAFKGFMISMAAHDFRSILTVLDGYQQVIRQNCDRSCRNELPVKMLEQTSRTIFRLQSMANTLFDVEAAEKGELKIVPVAFDFDSLLVECASFYRPYAAQKRVDLDVETPLPLMRALGDPARVLQIFDNLLYNAVKFTPSEGNIRIGSTPSEKGFVTATITDTGNGLPKSAIKELMSDTPGSAAHDETARLGMGLTICRRLIAQQNGRLGMTSEPGKGTVVSISLPSAD
jgi:signal transduction histidine kinase